MQPFLCDFHTHTYLSDGALGPVELIRLAATKGYRAIAITDHVSASTMERVIREAQADCCLAEEYWGITAIVGVELTHVPSKAVSSLAARARKLGAELVVVHGETIVEPVEAGTNLAAVTSPDVDILAHPGLITVEEARLAKENGIYLEASSRRGHSLTNGHLVTVARMAKASLLLNSDSHEPDDLHTWEFAQKVAQGSGMTEAEIEAIGAHAPQELLRKVMARRG